MADIKVEKRSGTPWMWLIIGAVALLLLLWALFAALTPDRPVAELEREGVAVTEPIEGEGVIEDERIASFVVPYQGHEWIPMDVDQAARMPDNQMVVVGSHQGVLLYANPDEAVGGGGGGVNPPAGLETQPWGRIYVRMDDGRYLPMVWSSEVDR